MNQGNFTGIIKLLQNGKLGYYDLIVNTKNKKRPNK